MPRTYAQHCALARALDRIGERWTLLIVRELLIGPARYSDLRAALPGLASNLLAQRLRELQAQGIVARRRLPAPAAATVVYELTTLGQGLEDAVHALIRWGGHWMRDAPATTEAFRPQWLSLAVRALTRPDDRSAQPLICLLDVDGHRFTLTARDGAVSTADGDEPGADVVLRTDARTMLAVASGAQRLDTAIDAGAVRAEGPPERVLALNRLWNASAPAPS